MINCHNFEGYVDVIMKILRIFQMGSLKKKWLQSIYWQEVIDALLLGEAESSPYEVGLRYPFDISGSS